MKKYDFLKNVNTTFRPGDDFFSYVNSAWIKKNPIPADRSRWVIFDALTDDVQHALKDILASVSTTKSSDVQLNKLRDYFLSGMNEKKLNSDGVRPIAKLLSDIDALRTKEDLSGMMADLYKKGVGTAWTLYLDYDDKDSSRYMLRISQSGLCLPDREYYVAQDEKSKDIRKQYLAFISSFLTSCGISADKKTVATILDIETRLARVSMSRTDLRDAHKIYNEYNLKKLSKLSPEIDWNAYFKKLGFKNEILKEFLVNQPAFLKEVNTLFKNLSLADWQAYLKWHVVVSTVPYLSESLVKKRFQFFGTVLSGAKKIRPRWKRVVAEVDDALGDILGKLYVEKFFPPEAKRRMNLMIDDIFAAYRERIKKLDWMSAATKKKALEKLSRIDRKIGYPTKWESYSSLKTSRDSFIENHWAACEFSLKDMIKKLTKKTVDRKEWHTSAPTVNAYFSPNLNEITFPAGILQPPSFDLTASDAMNYGGIGSVIGHELTHGFDDEGSKFDQEGNLKKWWSAADRIAFEKKAKKLVKQYDACEVLPGRFCNGKLTLGENIADLGGLTIAFDALQKRLQKSGARKSVNGFTPEQQFFIAWAREWAGSIREGQALQYLIVDPHSPLELRVNQVVNNLDAFYEAFNVQPSDKLYRKPGERVRIW